MPKPIEWRHDHGFMEVLLLGRGFDMRNVKCFFSISDWSMLLLSFACVFGYPECFRTGYLRAIH